MDRYHEDIANGREPSSGTALIGACDERDAITSRRTTNGIGIVEGNVQVGITIVAGNRARNITGTSGRDEGILLDGIKSTRY